MQGDETEFGDQLTAKSPSHLRTLASEVISLSAMS